jgi:membrane protein
VAENRLTKPLVAFAGTKPAEAESRPPHAADGYREPRRAGFLRLVRAIWNRCAGDSCPDLAAQVSFYFVLSAFPLLLVMSGILGWISTTSEWSRFAVWLISYMPMRMQHAVLITMLELARGYGAFLSFGLILTLWSASTGFLSLMDALSVANGVSEQRSYLKRRLIAICATVVAALFVVVCFWIWTAGHSLAGLISSNYSFVAPFTVQWRIARWVATLVMICLGVDLMNYFLPCGCQRWRWISAGSAFTVLAFVLASICLNLYMSYNPSISRVYGALASFIFLMFWIYLASLSLIVGAETDSALRELTIHRKAA